MSPQRRSTLLEALCILSFAGSSIAFLFCLLAVVFSHPARILIREWSSQYDVFQLTPVFFMVLAFLFAISFTGVLKMWKLKKAGLLIYTLARICIILFPVVWFRKPVFPSMAVIFSLLFFILYAREMFFRGHQSLDP